MHGRFAAWMLALALGPAAGAAPGSGDSDGASRVAPANGVAPWVLTSLLGYSSLSGSRPDWKESSTELLYGASPRLYLGARIDTRNRGAGTDVLSSGLLSHLLTRSFEWHARATVAANPVFSADQLYTGGLAWHAFTPVSLLLDYSRLNFSNGSLDQYQPGAILWFSDRTFLTGRYTYGRAFDSVHFETYFLRLDSGLPGGARINLSGAHGADPEKDGLAVITTTADTYGLYVHLPVYQRVELIFGGEYERREHIYSRSTGSAGVSLRF